MVLPEAWAQRDEFMALVGRKLASGPDRPDYYPGSRERYRRIIDAGGRVATYGRPGAALPPTVVHLDAGDDHPAFSEEAFCRVMAAVEIPGHDPAAYLRAATEFCNERLRGTLNATLLVDEDTRREYAAEVEKAVDDLRFGTVGVNVWAAAGFPLGVTPWGGFPGHALDDIGSGIGFVHNARLIDRPQKTVIHGPFVMFPKPGWSVFHRRGAAVLRRATAFEADPAAWRVPGLVAAAVLS